jgi:hypothetical protein
MNHSLLLGLFAFIVVGISFIRLLGENEFFRLTAMKRAWGRVRGLTMYFVVNVGLPLVVGIVFLAEGIAGFAPHDQRGYRAFQSLPEAISQARHSACQEIRVMIEKGAPMIDQWPWWESSQL